MPEDLFAFLFGAESAPFCTRHAVLSALCDVSSVRSVIHAPGVQGDPATYLGIRIFCKTKDGIRTVIVIDRAGLLDTLKLKFQDKEGIHPSEQNLIFDDRQLEGSRTLPDCDIRNKSTLWSVLYNTQG